MFSGSELALIKLRAMRRRVCFRVLDIAERIVLGLTIKCVEMIRSSKLTGIVATIFDKLANAVKSQLRRLIVEAACSLTRKLSRIAHNWSSVIATLWAADHDFVQYLTVMCMTRPAMSSYSEGKVMFFGFDVRVPPKIRSYLKNNPGAPFIIGFQALLLICAGLFILGNAELANGVATGAYFSLFIGVILQLIHFVTHGKEAGECDYSKDD